ncbi:MAG: leucyl aminopeptidase [Planctomycetota bacterium]|jgi:leucyl aminopeptidase|nr:leucyl aminopeptidase [Planctomycetota bacterium]
MDVKIAKEPALRSASQAILLPVLKSESDEKGFPYPELIERYGPSLFERMEACSFKAKIGQTFLLTPLNPDTPPLALVGLGAADTLDPQIVSEAHAQGAQKLLGSGARHILSVCRSASDITLDFWVRHVVQGVALSQYRFDSCKSKPSESPSIESLTLLSPEDENLERLSESARIAQILSRWIGFARDLGNLPANRATPSECARRIREATESLDLEVRIHQGLDAIDALSLPALHAVSQGSAEPPTFVEMELNPSLRGKRPTIALVGKGVTFDSGGISIKGSNNMVWMKCDMCGAANVAAAVAALAELRPDVHVLGFLPFCENLPSGTAYKPSDVVDTHAGLTVEIINTDGEGRMILADAISYARTFDPDVILDVATLTGASMVAVGKHYIAMIGNDSDAMAEIDQAAQVTGERVWPLPLDRHFVKAMKSDTADLKNAGGRFGGSSLAAAFLSQFAGDQSWVHLDIAPTGWTEKAQPCCPKGATGTSICLLTEFVLQRARSQTGD